MASISLTNSFQWFLNSSSVKASLGRFSSSITTSSCLISCSFLAFILFKDNPDVRFFVEAIPFSKTILGFAGSTNFWSSGLTFGVSFSTLLVTSTGFLTGLLTC